MNDSNISEDQSIDIMELINLLLDKKILLIFLGFFFVASSSIITMLMPQYWTASSSLMAVEGATGGGGAVGNSVANMVGVQLGSTNIKKGTIAVRLAKSRDFFKALAEDEELLVKLMAIDEFKDGKNIYNQEIYNTSSNKWVQGQPSFEAGYKAYRASLSTDYDWERGGFIEISVTHKSPIFTKELLDKIIIGLNNQYREKDLIEADKSLEYLMRVSPSVTNSDLRRSMSSLMQNQLKTKMFANVREYYLVEPLDSVYVPVLRSSPKRTRFVLMSTFLGMLLSCVFIISRAKFFSKPS